LAKTAELPALPRGRVVITTVSYGRPQDIARCLTSLEKSSFRDFEVFVVENAGPSAFERLIKDLGSKYAPATPESSTVLTDRTKVSKIKREARFALPTGQLITVAEATDNLGYGGGVNIALASLNSSAEWQGVWVLNPDTQPTPDALAHLVRHASSGKYGLVGCRVVLSELGTLQMRAGGEWWPLTARARSIDPGKEIDAATNIEDVEKALHWISGASAYATRRFVEAEGPMPEHYFLYCEDLDWSFKARKFGLGYAHDAIVYHTGGTTIGSASQLSKKSMLSIYLGQRNCLLLTKHWYPQLFPLVAVVQLALIHRLLVQGSRRAYVAGCKGWWAGIRGETGKPSWPGTGQ
jgi:GT2 family glycosyltransferase